MISTLLRGLTWPFRALFGESRSTYHPKDPALASLFGVGTNTAAGAKVTEDTALGVVSVLACVRIIAETVASLPVQVYRTRPDGGRDEDRKHPLFWLLHHEPNREMSAFTFKETLTGHLALRGNGLAYIERDGGGRPIALWPLRPDRVSLYRVNGNLYYTVYVPSSVTGKGQGQVTAAEVVEAYEPVTLPAASILHLRLFGSSGLVGYSPVTLAREAVGLTMATEEFGARYFGNQSRPGGLLKHPGKVGDEAQKRLKKSWEEIHSGLSNAHRIAVLEEGMDWVKVSVDNNDAQFLQTRLHQLEEIARLFRVPLYMLGNLQHASYASIEQQSIDFVTQCIRPYLVRWEGEITRALLPERERLEVYPAFIADALLRGDTLTRYQAHKIGREAGFLSPNEIRRMENRNPIDGGDDYLQPLNMGTVGSPEPKTPKAKPKAKQQDDQAPED